MAMREPGADTTHLPVRSVRSESCGIGISLRSPTERTDLPATTITESSMGCAPGATTVVAPISTFTSDRWQALSRSIPVIAATSLSMRNRSIACVIVKSSGLQEIRAAATSGGRPAVPRTRKGRHFRGKKANYLRLWANLAQELNKIADCGVWLRVYEHHLFSAVSKDFSEPRGQSAYIQGFAVDREVVISQRGHDYNARVVKACLRRCGQIEIESNGRGHSSGACRGGEQEEHEEAGGSVA